MCSCSVSWEKACGSCVAFKVYRPTGAAPPFPLSLPPPEADAALSPDSWCCWKYFSRPNKATGPYTHRSKNTTQSLLPFPARSFARVFPLGLWACIASLGTTQGEGVGKLCFLANYTQQGKAGHCSLTLVFKSPIESNALVCSSVIISKLKLKNIPVISKSFIVLTKNFPASRNVRVVPLRISQLFARVAPSSGEV